ncbi:biopolymer transport protein ExbD [Sphingomonas sp. F9_3S_D5_B_2]
MNSPMPQVQPALMTELNTTPLIDVLLVLLVMLIVTIPVQSHTIKLDLPQRSTVPPPKNGFNLLEITHGGSLLWKRQPITREGLKYNLEATQQMERVPELRFRPDARVRYEVVADVLVTMKREHVRRFGFVGNEAYANW